MFGAIDARLQLCSVIGTFFEVKLEISTYDTTKSIYAEFKIFDIFLLTIIDCVTRKLSINVTKTQRSVSRTYFREYLWT